MLNYNKTIAAIVVGATLTAFSPITQADIVINGTRIIYKESDKKITARLENKGSRPLLVQSWLDTGDDNVDPALIKVPFNATPPVSRIDPKKRPNRYHHLYRYAGITERQGKCVLV